MRVASLLLILLFHFQSQAMLLERELSFQDIKSWKSFSSAMEKQELADQKTGMAYMISGVLLSVGGSVGYHNAKTSVEKLAFSVTQSLGVAGVGYGAYLYHVGNEHQNFYQAVRGTTSMSEIQKNDLFVNYAAQVKLAQYNARWIRISSHALVAAVNFYNASREQEPGLKQGLNVIGAANALAALSLSF